MSNFLDINSLLLTSLSHSCNIQIKDNKVSFVFNDIKLPYNGIDKIGCNGYIAFRVKPKSTVINGKDILNKAAIYFDYNLPIITNTKVTKNKNLVVKSLKFVGYELKTIYAVFLQIK